MRNNSVYVNTFYEDIYKSVLHFIQIRIFYTDFLFFIWQTLLTVI